MICHRDSSPGRSDSPKTAEKTHQDMSYPNVTSLCFATLLRLTSPTEAFPWDDLRKILQKGQRVVKVQNGEEILPKVLTP